MTTSFFSSPVVSRYIMPLLLPEKYPQEFSEDYLNVAATKTITQNISSAAPLGINGVFYTTQTKTPPLAVTNPLILSTASSLIIGVLGNVSRYTAPYDGFYLWRISATLDNITAPLAVFNYTFYNGGSPGPDTGQQITISPIDNGKTFSFEGVFQLESGAKIESYCYLSAGNLDIDFATLEIIGEANIVKDTPIDFKYLFVLHFYLYLLIVYRVG